MRKVRFAGVALALMVVAVACSDEAPVAGPGTLTATIVGPNGAEGAAVVALLGDGVTGVTPFGETEVRARVGAASTQIVLIHPTGGDLTFQVAVSDTTQLPAFVVQEVAAPTDELRSDVTAYRVEYAR